jgi:hypothetical protein
MNGVSTETLRLILDVQDRMNRELSGAHNNIRRVDRELGRVKGSFRTTATAGNRLGETLKRIFSVAIITMAIRKVVEFGKKIIMLGSNAEEIESKFRVVFKHLTKEADTWTKKFSKSVGRSANDLRKYMAVFQDTFVPLGFAREQGLEFSKVLTRLTVDLASFNNMAEADVMRDMQSGIVGNTEVFRKYGVIINQVTLNQELLNMGIEGGVRAATEAQKAQARLNLVIKGTADAQGDAIRTGGSFANIMRKIGATSERILTGLGKAILPVAGKIATMADEAMQPFADWIEEHQTQITNFFLHIPEIAGLVFRSIIPILKDILTGMDFAKIVGSMSQILMAGFRAAVLSFADFLGATINSIPELIMIATANIGKILTESIGRMALPKILRTTEPLGVEEYYRYILEHGGKWERRELEKGGSKKLREFYERYVREWEEANAEFIQFHKEANEEIEKALKKIEVKFTPAVEGATEYIQEAWKEIQTALGDIGVEGLKALDTKAQKELLQKIAEILNRELPTIKETTETIADQGEKPEAMITGIPEGPSWYTGMYEYRGERRPREGYYDPEYYARQQEEIAENMQNVSGMFNIVSQGLGEFGSSLITNMMAMGPIGALYTALEPVLKGILEILSPVIEETLQPLLEFLGELGIIIGQLLLPQLQILAPFIEILATVLTFLVNKAIVPLANVIIKVYKWLAQGVAYIWNAIATVLNAVLGWTGLKLEMIEVADIEEIQPIEGTKAPERTRTPGKVINIYIQADGFIDEEAEFRVAERLKTRLIKIEETGR